MTRSRRPAPIADYLGETLARDADLRRLVDEELAQMRVTDDLIRLRMQHGLSQGQLARALGISQSAIAQLESGKTKNLGIRTIARIAVALGATVKVSIEPRADR
ncbi:MAG TPA: helix-turn-helix transcriptional regulator [Gemmatimonadales bacterium]|nr:helix-turn-helix transcriptional regulator [Gemmatimonadales bacterium]